MTTMRRLAVSVGFLAIGMAAGCATATPPAPPTNTPSATPVVSAVQYTSPLANAEYVSPRTTIAVRYGPQLSAQDLAKVTFSVRGSMTGAHAGQTILADDDKTLIFKPDEAFVPAD